MPSRRSGHTWCSSPVRTICSDRRTTLPNIWPIAPRPHGFMPRPSLLHFRGSVMPTVGWHGSQSGVLRFEVAIFDGRFEGRFPPEWSVIMARCSAAYRGLWLNS